MIHIRLVVLSVVLLVVGVIPAVAQTPGTGVPQQVPTLVKELHIMPYVTASYNRFSGKAFPISASGVGYGAGLVFDLTTQEQRTGVYFDFAFQDMRGVAKNGSCVHANDTVLEPADAYHYWQYILFEPFLKMQRGDGRGYFLIGASFGFATKSQTDSRGDNKTESTSWEGTELGNQFRLDIRAGVGVKLADFGGHGLIFEGRFGYPLTAAIANFKNVCGGGELGNWQILTVQGNLGLRI
jgi:hypothetical protein